MSIIIYEKDGKVETINGFEAKMIKRKFNKKTVLHEFNNSKIGIKDFFKDIKLTEDNSIILNIEILEYVINTFKNYDLEFNEDLNEYNRTTGKQQEAELLNLGMKLLK